MFTTYATLINTYTVNKKKIPRLDQIISFLGGSDAKKESDGKIYSRQFKGVIIFDEWLAFLFDLKKKYLSSSFILVTKRRTLF